MEKSKNLKLKKNKKIKSTSNPIESIIDSQYMTQKNSISQDRKTKHRKNNNNRRFNKMFIRNNI